MHTGRDVLDSLLHVLTANDIQEQKESDSAQAGSDTTVQPYNDTIAKTPRVRNVLVTLHFLFPHELLPALDLIDRRLITKIQWSIQPEPDTTENDDNSDETEKGSGKRTMFLVQSASAANSSNDIIHLQHQHDGGPSAAAGRFRNAYNSAQTYYEVDLDGWNCSCPAFAFSSIQQLLADGADTSSLKKDTDANGQSSHTYCAHGGCGGSDCATKRASPVPVCKHILAVCLCQAGPRLFGHAVNHQEVSRQVLAGWSNV